MTYIEATSDDQPRWYRWEGTVRGYLCTEPRRGTIYAVDPSSAAVRLQARGITLVYIEEYTPWLPGLLAFLGRFAWILALLAVVALFTGSVEAATKASPALATSLFASSLLIIVCAMVYAAHVRRTNAVAAEIAELAKERAATAEVRRNLALKAAELEADLALLAADPEFTTTLIKDREQWERKLREVSQLLGSDA